MNAARRLRLWNIAVDHARGRSVTIEHVCAAAISAAGVDGSAIVVMLSATPREVLYASDPITSELEELTVTLGEGPGVDAFAGGPALVADLTAAESLIRWPAFAPAAVDAGIRAMFALPLQVGGIGVGVMDLFREWPGNLEREQLADALELADTVCALLLDAADREPVGHTISGPERARPQDPEVHQATGMITVQLGVTIAEALVRLRAYAYTNELRLRDVAADVVARRLRFDSDADGG